MAARFSQEVRSCVRCLAAAEDSLLILGIFASHSCAKRTSTISMVATSIAVIFEGLCLADPLL